MKKFRTIVFWMHLACGVAAGLVIGIMCLTGAALAFEKQMIAWAERDVTRVSPPAGSAPRLSLETMAAGLHEMHPEARPSTILVNRDPARAVTFSLGRDGAYHVNPYTGGVCERAAPRMRAIMRTLTVWHRWLAMSGENRATGRAVTGACNLVFLFLTLTGLYIWLPRVRNWRVLRSVLWFNNASRGRARDWNWHNVIGFWAAPILIVLTVSGSVISYRWATNLVYALAGSEPPAERSVPRSGTLQAAAAPQPPAASPAPSNLDMVFSAAGAAIPDWKEITIRLDAGGGRPDDAGAAQSMAVAVKSEDQWPPFSSITLRFDRSTGAELARETLAQQDAGRQARSWLRFLHTGEALGWVGQTVAGLASLGGAVLVYTGMALAWRRFFVRRRSPQASRPSQRRPGAEAVAGERMASERH